MVHRTMVDFFMGAGGARGEVMYILIMLQTWILLVDLSAEVKITRTSATCRQMRSHSTFTTLNACRWLSSRRAARQT